MPPDELKAECSLPAAVQTELGALVRRVAGPGGGGGGILSAGAGGGQDPTLMASSRWVPGLQRVNPGPPTIVMSWLHKRMPRPPLPRRDGGWPPRHATCPDLGLLLAPGPTTKPWPGNNGDQLSRNDGAVASNSQKGHYVTL